LKLGNGRYCFPLTVSDHAARFLLLCEALAGRWPHARRINRSISIIPAALASCIDAGWDEDQIKPWERDR